MMMEGAGWSISPYGDTVEAGVDIQEHACYARCSRRSERFAKALKIILQEGYLQIFSETQRPENYIYRNMMCSDKNVL
jgi:hypothetical protein